VDSILTLLTYIWDAPSLGPAWGLPILTKVFCAFPQFLHANNGIVT